jgi:hypothetical protein
MYTWDQEYFFGQVRVLAITRSIPFAGQTTFASNFRRLVGHADRACDAAAGRRYAAVQPDRQHSAGSLPLPCLRSADSLLSPVAFVVHRTSGLISMQASLRRSRSR